MRRFAAKFVFVLAALTGGCNSSSGPSFQLTDITGADFGRDIRLTDHTGKPRTLADFKGKSLDYFTTHADLVKRQTERKAAQKAAAANPKVVKADGEWSGDSFVQQSDALSEA